MSDTYWIMRREQVEALTSPIRHEILDRLAADGPVSVRDLAAMLGRKPTAIYHHIKRLIAVDLVRSLEPQGGRGRPSLLYGTVAPRMRMARSAEIPENRPLIAKGARAMAAIAATDFAAAFEGGQWRGEGEDRNHWFFRVVTSPSPERLSRINHLLDELAELVWAVDPEPGPPISIAWFLAPLDVKRPSDPDHHHKQEVLP